MPHDLDHQANIPNILKNLHGIEPLRELFWTDTAKNALADDPVLFTTGGTDDAFDVIDAHLNSDRLLLTAERPVISKLLQDHP